MSKETNIHNLAFGVGIFFLLGIVLASFINNFLIITFAALLGFFYLFLIDKKIIAFLFLFIIFGAIYFNLFSYFQFKNINIPYNENIKFEGIVTNARNGSVQQLEISLLGEYKGKINLKTTQYPQFNYGDKIEFEGTIKELSGEYKNYYLTKSIVGEINFPAIKVISTDNGSFVKSQLFNLRTKIRNIFQSILSKEKAAFLAGITIGSREDFSKEFKEKMSLSGTTHLVALSGYNITVIILAASIFFSSIFSVATSFYFNILTVILFVIMTGAEASVVRAAIMGVIVVLSQRMERLSNPRNAIVVAALIMALFNPRVLVFDIGFQLSFAALIGIIYLAPVIKNIFSANGGSASGGKIFDKGFLSWKENAITTFSAQIFALPILLSNFGIFSLASIVANVLILEFIPVTMGIGFTIAFLGMFSLFLAKILGYLVNIIISYEFFIINIFSKFSIPIKIESGNLYFWILYYLAIFAVVLIFREKDKELIN